MILRRHELQKLVEIHYGYGRNIPPDKVSDDTADWEKRDTSAALKGRKRSKETVPITLKLPPYYFQTREKRRALGILLLCNELSGVEVKSLLHVDQGTVSRWNKPAYSSSFRTAKIFLAGIMSAKGFSDENIQADLRIDSINEVKDYRGNDEWKYAYKAWLIHESARISAVFHEVSPRRGSNL